MANKQMLIDAAEKFIGKVDNGKAMSIVTYKELKKALAADEVASDSTAIDRDKILSELKRLKDNLHRPDQEYNTNYKIGGTYYLDRIKIFIEEGRADL